MSEELTTYSAAQLARMMRTRVVSPVEVVEAYLRRIERLNPTLNAIVALAPDALERAREAEDLIMHGSDRAALRGVPVTVKDTIDVAGLSATAGTKIFEQRVANRDAPGVTLLRDAGAIILGKTNTSEMALDYTSNNPVYGRTNNPYDLARTPGGSSGGCAVAVAACLTPASLGSDLAGSIRIPAHFCGVAGLKPTAGRISGVGHFPPMNWPYERAASLGPLARRVEDLGLLLHVLTGEAFEPAHSEVEPSSAKSRDGMLGRRVAFYTDDGATPVTDEIRDAVRKAAAALQAFGLDVREARPPGVEHATRLWLELFSSATAKLVTSIYEGRREDAGRAALAVLRRAEKSPAKTSEGERHSWAERDLLRAELLRWMETTPLIVAPVGAVP
ncbi:MAG: amidase, partial [Pyrinomonadaceae bacterium]